MKQILVAGIGNIFQGDDAFGCEVIRQINPEHLPKEVTVTDFGIRSYDLAYALTSNYDAVILIDAASRGEPPGTLYLIEPDMNRLGALDRVVDAHAMNPVSVIQMAQAMGEVKGKLYLVGCEPEVLDSESGELELSGKVKAAVPQALSMIESLIKDLLDWKGKTLASFVLA